jgi:choline kinase
MEPDVRRTPTVVILGAGRPHRGTVPSALRRDRGGVPVLEWLLDAFATDPTGVVFVGGYGVDEVRARYPALDVVVPADWEGTGSAESLLAAVPADDGPTGPVDDRVLDVVYSDVLLRPALIEALRDASAGADVVVAWDSRWRERFPGRIADDLRAREKVVVLDGRIVRSGVSIATAEADGEFVGVVRLGPDALRALDAFRAGPDRAALQQEKLSGVVQRLIDAGSRVVGVDVAGDWAEVDEPADIARFVLGTKADTLARLQRTVKAATIADQVTFTVGEWEQTRDVVTERISAAFAGRDIIVRSSTTHEDSFAASNAGGFTSVLGVRGRAAVEAAVDRVIESYRIVDLPLSEQQVLVQPMVDGVALSGVVLTRTLDHGAPWRTIEYSVGSDTETVTSGAAGDVRTVIARRDADVTEVLLRERAVIAQLADDELRALGALLVAVEEVERLLGYDALDIEFAIDAAGEVHLLQVRPLVAAVAGPSDDAAFVAASGRAHREWSEASVPPTHLPGAPRPMYGVMPDWNPAEIIGTAPGRLAVDLYRRLVTDEVWAEQRAGYGYRDVRPLPLLRIFAGRPYVDVRASFASFLPATLDDRSAARLLDASLERLAGDPALHDKVEFEVVPTCVDPDWQRWDRRLTEEGFASEERATLRAALTRITVGAFDRVDSDRAAVAALEAETAVVVASRADPLERAADLLRVTARWGTLPFAHLARGAFIAVSLLRGAEAQGLLSGAAVTDFLGALRTAGHGLTEDARAVAVGASDWTAFVDRWGHLRPGTYDVTSPRYDADPERFLRPLVENASAGDPAVRSDTSDPEVSARLKDHGDLLRALALLGLPSGPEAVDRFLRGAIEGREWSKLAFTRPLSDAIECIATGWERRGVAREEIVDVPLEMLLPDRNGVVLAAAHVREAAQRGREERSVTSAMPFSPLICTESDLDVFVLSPGVPNFVGTSSVIAPVVELDEGADTSPEVRGRIVLIPRADPGFDWLFGHGIAGLVTLYGGANSHMAIRAAEFGLPAAIGVGPQQYSRLSGAVEMELDPVGHTLRVLR